MDEIRDKITSCGYWGYTNPRQPQPQPLPRRDQHTDQRATGLKRHSPRISELDAMVQNAARHVGEAQRKAQATADMWSRTAAVSECGGQSQVRNGTTHSAPKLSPRASRLSC